MLCVLRVALAATHARECDGACAPSLGEWGSLGDAARRGQARRSERCSHQQRREGNAGTGSSSHLLPSLSSVDLSLVGLLVLLQVPPRLSSPCSSHPSTPWRTPQCHRHLNCRHNSNTSSSMLDTMPRRTHSSGRWASHRVQPRPTRRRTPLPQPLHRRATTRPLLRGASRRTCRRSRQLDTTLCHCHHRRSLMRLALHLRPTPRSRPHRSSSSSSRRLMLRTMALLPMHSIPRMAVP